MATFDSNDDELGEFTFDADVPDHRIAQLACFLEHVPDDVMGFLEQAYTGDQTKEYYRGLIAGFRNAYVTYNNIPEGTDIDKLFVHILSFLADRYRKTDDYEITSE